MKKYLFVLITFLAVILLSACNRDSNLIPGGEQIQKDKTQLYVSNFNGGIGTDWLYKVKSRYEEMHKDDIYEEGKKGVQIVVIPHKDNGFNMIDTFAGSTNEVIFNEYIRYNDWVANNLLLDITDVVKSTCNGESRTIEDKLYDTQKAFLQKNGVYYAIPHYSVYQGLMYNVDLFEQKGLYFAKEIDNGNDGFIVKGEEKSCGPDGVYNTYDDGLPSSYEEFFKLCDYMVQRGVTPFVWTGQYASDYTQYILNALYQNYEGKDDVMLNYSFDSKDKTTEIVTKIENGKPVTSNVKITPETGYLLKQQTGRYYAIDFFSRVLSNSSYYHPFSTGNLTLSHTDAQELFLESSLKNEPIAFLIDGTWWENEAKVSGAIDRMVNKYGDVAKNRNFGFMPLPRKVDGRVEEGEGSNSVIMDYINAYAGINKDIPTYKIDLAKDFLLYCYSDEILELFTETTGIAKGIKYDISTESFNKMSKFAQSVWELKNNSEIIYPNSNSLFFMQNQTSLTVDEWVSTVNGSLENIYTHLKNKVNKDDVFMGNAISEKTWRDKYFNN